jgi:hypothetical protein
MLKPRVVHKSSKIVTKFQYMLRITYICVDVNSALLSMKSVDVWRTADDSEMNTASIFRDDVIMRPVQHQPPTPPPWVC